LKFVVYLFSILLFYIFVSTPVNTSRAAEYFVSNVNGVQFFNVVGNIRSSETQRLLDVFYREINPFLPTVVKFFSGGGYINGLESIKRAMDTLRFDIAAMSRVRAHGYIELFCKSACVPAYFEFAPDVFAAASAKFGFHAASGGLNPRRETEKIKDVVRSQSGSDWMERNKWMFDSIEMTDRMTGELHVEGFNLFRNEEKIIYDPREVIDHMLLKVKGSHSCYLKEEGTIFSAFGSSEGSDRTMVQTYLDLQYLPDVTLRINTKVKIVKGPMISPTKPKYLQDAFYRIQVSKGKKTWVSAKDIYCARL